ncbi:hypothetical protein M8312_02400 [Sphingomonas sp. KRR8]|uniref:hypothetical protein n=1 Tax=Sphingomonas sp. KRR8 TaxID=2942996 RepID=UPI00201FB58F|nr:hypothetical protein [Sphingomonas sp. KRR8]URD61385.1 hypothetical protein M8312_02400 [Sphingomonas sp. KRR8]
MTVAALLLSVSVIHGAPLAALAPSLQDSAITDPRDWRREPAEKLTAALAVASPAERQQVRWRYALSSLAEGRPEVALAALQVMQIDEPDLALSAAFQLARGRALAELGRGTDSAAVLSGPALAHNPEACAWRLRAFEAAGAPPLALAELSCAKPALRARAVPDRAAFLLAASRAALAAGRPDAALDLLRFVAEHLPEARLLRARALLAQGQGLAALGIFNGLAASPDPRIVSAAELGSIEAGLATHRLAASPALGRLSRLTFHWRGDAIERQALFDRFALATSLRNPSAQLSSAATLVRYRAAGGGLAAVLASAQETLAGLLTPGSKVSLADAAGLYWDYRDLGPNGAAGDALAWQLADRLQEAQLYARAADLLQHQLVERARDVAQGPVSVRVARLWILAGHPDRALEALHLSTDVIFPPAMLQARQRMEAIALHQLGRTGEALAILQSVPGSGALQAELMWKQHSWAAYAAAADPHLPPPHALSEVQQALVLRQAVTLGMLGREAPLAALRQRYAAAFADLPTARAFDQLTRPSGEIDAAGLSDALAALPTASPAGDMADLIELSPPARRGG